MRTYLVCEDESLGGSIRNVLLRERVECPVTSLTTYAQAAKRLAEGPADLIVAVLPDDPIKSVEALDLLATVHRGEQTVVIAVGPAADAKLVIRALRGVVDDYVDVNEMETELVASLAGFRKNWAPPRPDGRLVAVLAPSGGAGSSTIAASLAVLMARQAGSAALVDLKHATGDLASLLDLKPTYSLADLSKHLDRLDEVLLRRTLVEHTSGVHLLAAPRLLADASAITVEGTREVIRLARSAFPSVVVDLDHDFGDEQVEVLRQADAVLVVLRPDFTSLRNVARFLEHLDTLGIARDRIRVVVNQAGQAGEVSLAKAEETLNTRMISSIPHEPKVVQRAGNNGVPVVLAAPSSKVAKCLVKLAQAIEVVLSQAAEPGSKNPEAAKAGPLAALKNIAPSRWAAQAEPPRAGLAGAGGKIATSSSFGISR
jgi:pilus assembly protein CpaE